MALDAFKQRILLGSAVVLLSLTFANSQPRKSGVSCSLSLSSRENTPKPSTSNDIDTMLARRIPQLTRGVTDVSDIPAWISSLGENGEWPASEVDYTSGCDARRANWPAQAHWNRLYTMAGAWHGGIPQPDGDQYAKDPQLLDAVSRAINYWLDNDYKNLDCMNFGGKPACPCGTPGLWNTNWFSNIILIPRLVGRVCLLVQDALTPEQLTGCTHILSRAYNQFYRDTSVVGKFTGANTLDIASLSIDLGLLTRNQTILEDCYQRVHEEMNLQGSAKADGIRHDGSFGQHNGVLYNGNYGKDFVNAVLSVEVNAGGTQYAAGDEARDAFSVLISGDQWMIYQNTLTGTLHWDFSVLGRFISFPVSDGQATSSIKVNVTDVKVLGDLWDSNSLRDFASNMTKETSSANIGDIRGNRMFYNNDYMVHRGSGYVTTVKMFSPRSRNTECLNNQNPFGFHLSDGAVHTYVKGDEYEDIAASWDWNLIPGTTVDYNGTPLTCASGVYGAEAFVGGVSDTLHGLAAMRYTNPTTHNITWQKAWFFLSDDVHMVLLSDMTSTSPDVITVLDQRKKDGEVYVDGLQQEAYHHTDAREFRHGLGKRSHHRRRAVPIADNNNITRYTAVESLWHGGVGYTFDANSPLTLSVQTGEKRGDWSKLGISKEWSTVDLFTAWVDQTAETFAYTVYPGTTHDDFQRKRLASASQYKVIQNDKHISAVIDGGKNLVMIVFWDAEGGSVTIPPTSLSDSEIVISVDANSAVMYRVGSSAVTVSDPSQTKQNVGVQLEARGGVNKPRGFEQESVRKLSFDLPLGGFLGSSVSQVLS